MQRSEIDGVTVFSGAADGPLRAELSFNARGETLDTMGLTQLVQSLVLWGEPVTAPEASHLASEIGVTFSATGTPEEIVTHLDSLCREIADPLLEELDGAIYDTDKSLRYNGLFGITDAGGSLLARRYGTQRPGLVRWPAVDPDQFTAEEVAAHAAQWFTTGNALLELSGPIPEGLRLPLRPGARSPFDKVFPETQGPYGYEDEVAGPGMSFPVALDKPSYVAYMLLWRRVYDAVGNDAESLNNVIDARTHETTFYLRAEEGAHTMFDAAQRLAHDGPTDAELAGMLSQWDGFNPWGFYLMELEMCGADPRIEDEPVGADQVRSLVAQWLASALWVRPRGSRVEIPGVTFHPEATFTHAPSGTVIRPGLARRLLGRRKDYVVADESGLSYVDDEGRVHSFPRSEVIAGRERDRLWLGNTARGTLFDMSAFGDDLDAHLPPRRLRA